MRCPRTRMLLLAVTVAVFATLGCGSNVLQDSDLAGQLASLVPQADEVASVFGELPTAHAEVGEASFRSNEQMAGELPGALLNTTRNLDQIRATGRIHGYSASYRVSSTAQPGGIGVRVAIDLYDSPMAAQRAMEIGPPSASGEPLDAPIVGDASTAWPRSLVGDQADCPCEFYFLAGPFLAAVRTSYSGGFRFYNGQVDPAQVAVARLIAGRLQEAIAMPSNAPTPIQ